MALPKDELELISKKLTFDPDYTRFRSVCKSWRSAAPKRPQLPWLISYHRTNLDKNSILASFYQFSFQTNKIIRIPEFSDSPLLSSFIDDSTDCIASSRAWLALINRGTSSVLLFNPFTNSSIDLPNWSKDVFVNCNSKFYLTSDPSESLSDCFAVIYHYGLSYCKVGSNAWVKLTVDPCFYISHFCSYHGKYFIASEGDVFVCDFGPESSVCNIISVSLDDDDTYSSEIEFTTSYLVESDDDLLLVLVYYIADFYSYYYRVLKLEVECHLPKSVELQNLGNKALFLSGKTAFSVTSSKYPGCRESSIYSAFIISKDGRLVQTLDAYNFGGLLKTVRMKNDIAPSNIDYKCDWFSPSLLM